ncbi:MAG: hypothetical protein RIS44_508 [Pseudomonadota bacterium]|jgi:two-component system chemotaxis response regulator CheB
MNTRSPHSEAPIRVMLIDDSAVARAHLTGELSKVGMQVVAAASDPIEAWPLLPVLNPDVIVLDIDMPRMDGLSFLRQLMAQRPTPVVMCSSLTQNGRAIAIQAMNEGAVAVVGKPGSGGVLLPAAEVAQALVDAVRVAAKAQPCRGSLPAVPLPNAVPSSAGASEHMARQVIAMGLSTGGVQALTQVLKRLSPPLPGLLIVQHMPAEFTASLAQQLNHDMPQLDVREAQDGDAVAPGRVLIAPGGKHMLLRGSLPRGWVVEITHTAAVNYHRPSVDVLFHSVAQAAGPQAIGVLMTGMGDDGAQGLLAMRQAGGRTAAQDEATSAVYGMPAAAAALQAAQKILPLQEVARWLMEQARGPTKA